MAEHAQPAGRQIAQTTQSPAGTGSLPVSAALGAIRAGMEVKVHAQKRVGSPETVRRIGSAARGGRSDKQ